ncbi:hypothetical protein PgNI_10230, partial [Pyricularia grisea]|uniref:Secreted protein n=1 Tax=Pyricularia grisea TaxID=148305 RepID=A0A6P8AYY3_PYRGI
GFFFFFFFFALPRLVWSARYTSRLALLTVRLRKRVRSGSLMASSMSALRWLWRGSVGSAAQSSNVCSPFRVIEEDWLVALVSINRQHKTILSRESHASM